VACPSKNSWRYFSEKCHDKDQRRDQAGVRTLSNIDTAANIEKYFFASPQEFLLEF
jgi:hypothetical protein